MTQRVSQIQQHHLPQEHHSLPKRKTLVSCPCFSVEKPRTVSRNRPAWSREWWLWYINEFNTAKHSTNNSTKNDPSVLSPSVMVCICHMSSKFRNAFSKGGISAHTYPRLQGSPRGRHRNDIIWVFTFNRDPGWKPCNVQCRTNYAHCLAWQKNPEELYTSELNTVLGVFYLRFNTIWTIELFYHENYSSDSNDELFPCEKLYTVHSVLNWKRDHMNTTQNLDQRHFLGL